IGRNCSRSNREHGLSIKPRPRRCSSTACSRKLSGLLGCRRSRITGAWTNSCYGREGEWLMLDLEELRLFVGTIDYAPLFVTVSGAHLYGFPSPDSDIDLRGCHVLPLRDVVGLSIANETKESKIIHRGTEVELVSHDIGKYLRLLLKNNGYVLEQIFSPI